MPYIGTTPTKVVSRQSANVYRYTATAGQSVFTGADLDNNVLACNPADMIVHMNGLRLESTDYTATSTSVTLTTAATAGDEVTVTSFVTFEVADTYTKTAADDRYVNASGDTMTGTLDVDASVFGRSFEFRAGSNALTHGVAVHSTVANTLQFNTQSVERMRIDSAGRVTMPYQPAFVVYRGSGNYAISGGITESIIYDTAETNIGGHFNTSNYRFTAPVSGLYHFSASVNNYNMASNTAFRCQLHKNGASYAVGTFTYTSNGGDHNVVFSGELQLSSGDYVEMMRYTSNACTVSAGRLWNWFSGHLIG